MTPRLLKIVCAISIFLNIFLVAAAVAGVYWAQTRRPMIGAGAIRVAGAELPQAERRAFRQTLRAARREIRPMIQADRQARRDAAALLRAPSVDQAALAAALARVRDADIRIRTHVEGRAVAFIATLPQGDRAKLADVMERRAGSRAR